MNADGHREVLGVKVATCETAAAWNAFFADLVARGLTSGPDGVALVTLSESEDEETQFPRLVDFGRQIRRASCRERV